MKIPSVNAKVNSFTNLRKGKVTLFQSFYQQSKFVFRAFIKLTINVFFNFKKLHLLIFKIEWKSYVIDFIIRLHFKLIGIKNNLDIFTWSHLHIGVSFANVFPMFWKRRLLLLFYDRVLVLYILYNQNSMPNRKCLWYYAPFPRCIF